MLRLGELPLTFKLQLLQKKWMIPRKTQVNIHMEARQHERCIFAIRDRKFVRGALAVSLS